MVQWCSCFHPAIVRRLPKQNKKIRLRHFLVVAFRKVIKNTLALPHSYQDGVGRDERRDNRRRTTLLRIIKVLEELLLQAPNVIPLEWRHPDKDHKE